MRGLLLIAAAIAFCVAGSAAAADAPAPPAEPVAAAPAAEPPTIEQLQRQLAAAQAELARLRATDAAVAVSQRDVCDAKNIRLVEIARAILADYRKRFGSGFRDPIQINRTRFETVAQDFAGQIYDNRYDVPARAPAEPETAPTKQRKRKNETKN